VPLPTGVGKSWLVSLSTVCYEINGLCRCTVQNDLEIL